MFSRCLQLRFRSLFRELATDCTKTTLATDCTNTQQLNGSSKWAKQLQMHSAAARAGVSEQQEVITPLCLEKAHLDEASESLHLQPV